MRSIVEISLNNRIAVVFSLVLIMAAGIFVAFRLPVDAVPDVTNVQVIVNAKTGGLDPQQVEKSVTFFVEAEMAGIPRVREVRSLSRFGLSQTVVVFEDRTDIYWARQQVAERMRMAGDKIPRGINLAMAPISTGLGEVLMYTLQLKADSPHKDESEPERLVYLRTVQDFILKPYLKSHVPGAAEIDSLGGYEKQIDIDVDPVKMERQGITLNALAAKLRTLGENFGGGYIEQKAQQVIVRTNGAFPLQALLETPIRLSYDGRQIRLKEIADMRTYHPQRVGAATYRGEEAVLGTVLMLMGQNSRETATAAEEALASAPLPADVEARVVYTRSYLVGATVKTVAKNLAEGAAIVILILLFFLGNLRAALFVSLAIPVSFAFALAGMHIFNISANLMSLGALDFGLIVDGSIVMVENLLTKMEHRPPANAAEKIAVVRDAALEVLAPMVTGMLIIMSVYVPILTLEGTEGKLYYPMAMTVLFALTGALAMAVVAIPVLGYYVRLKPGAASPGFFTAVQRFYAPALNFPLRNIRKLMIPMALFLLVCGWLFSRLGSDFMPPLGEGDMTINLLHDARISLSESLAREKKAEKIILSHPEVETVFGRIGTSEAATDPMGVNLSDLFVILKKDTSLWRKNTRGKTLTKTELFRLIEADLKPVLAAAAGLENTELVETQPIAMRVNEMLEGSRAEVSLRIFGRNLDTLMELQNKVTAILKKIPGAAEVELDALTALRKTLMLDARIRHERINYYGIPISQVNETLETAMVGHTVGSLYEHDWRFRIDLIIDDAKRKNLSLIRKIPVALPEGGNINLGDVVDFSYAENVTSIARSAMNRYAGVAVFLGNRDTLSFVSEAREKIAKELQLPDDYRIVWGGQFKNLERARLRLLIIVPLILAVIAFLVYRTFRSARQTFLIFLTVPFSWTGGVLALWFSGIHFSVSAAVGFIALSGVAVLNGLVKVSYLNQLRTQGKTVAEAVRLGALGRLRPVLMTAAVASLGFLPMVMNTGIGAEVQRPLAVVVLGGLVTATLMTLFLMPAIYRWMEKDR